MVPEGGYKPGATGEMMIFFGLFILVGVIMMILDYLLSRKRQQPQQQEISSKKSISPLKLIGLLIAGFGALGIFITFLFTL